jgi:GTP-binding protein
MDIKSVRFLTSNTQLSAMPPADKPEFAFVGRSNVGKSSLINALMSRKDLARVSSTPGKTQTVNHFVVNEAWYLVDLPGYGYARVSRTQRAEFSKMIRDYVTKRENLACVFVLVDMRIPPQESDLAFLKYLGENGVPVAILFTKADKVSQSEKLHHQRDFKKAIMADWEEMPPNLLTSSVTGLGRKEVLDFIQTSMGK